MKYIVFLTQILAYPLLYLLRVAFVRHNLLIHQQLKSIKKGHHYVLYANHQSKLDPFLILASFPLLVLLQLLPIRSFLNNAYYINLPVTILLNTFGCFPAYHIPHGLYGLEKAKQLLSTHQTIGIFPSGKRTREKIAKTGIAVLASQPNIHLIPVYINWNNRLSCEIIIGKPFIPKKKNTSEELMEKVYALASN